MVLHLQNKKFARESLLINYGINRVTAAKLIGIARLHPLAIRANLKKQHPFLERRAKNLKIGYKLKFHVFKRILLAVKNMTYRGIRHLQHLPVRGQRTHTNAGTQNRLHKLGKYFPFAVRAKRIYITKKTKETAKANAKKNAKSKAKSKKPTTAKTKKKK